MSFVVITLLKRVKSGRDKPGSIHRFSGGQNVKSLGLTLLGVTGTGSTGGCPALSFQNVALQDLTPEICSCEVSVGRRSELDIEYRLNSDLEVI